MMKKCSVLLISMILMVCLCGCNLWPVYYSQSEVEEVVKKVVGEDIEYVSEKKDTKNLRIIYTFADAVDREFTFTAYSEHADFIDGASFPWYDSGLRDSYLKSIWMWHKEEIDEILYQTIEENEWTLDRYDCPVETEETSQVSLPVMDSPVFITMDTYSFSEEARDEDIRQLAKMGVQMDTILDYTYDCNAEDNEDIIYRGDDECTIILNFENKEAISNLVSFQFSLSEETRWTEESLYEHLRKKYDETVKRKLEG